VRKIGLAGVVWLLGAPCLLLAQSLPKLAQEQGRATLLVDGKPFFEVGAQVDNSSGWPEALAAVWPRVERMKLNTLEVPVYWEQMEPTRGSFDFSSVDAVLAQAREHHTHLVLLWFATWKNGKMHYVPDWVKSDTKTYPRMRTRHGEAIDVLSPNEPANLNADRTAFVALMRHLREADAIHTVILVQVENESGSLGSVRDFSPSAQAQFAGPVPGALWKGLHKQPGTWAQVFGEDADETFAAWSVASYIGQIAAAGKQQLALPMYVNNWLKSPRAYPVQTIPGDDYPSGGPTGNMMPVWKIAAPAIDLLAPDIYVPSTERYQAVMREFHTPDNPLLVPESIGFGDFPGASGYGRFPFLALGQGAIGFAPFGLDRFSIDPPLSAQNSSVVEGLRLLGSLDRVIAALSFAGKLQTAVEDNGIAQRELAFGSDRVLVSFPPGFDPPAATSTSPTDTTHLKEGRAIVAQLGPDEFLVAGIDCRVQFLSPIHGDRKVQLVRVEEGRYNGETWVPTRLLNGDETDYGLNFHGKGTILHVKIGLY
jgi:beta-galactosidase GanA